MSSWLNLCEAKKDQDFLRVFRIGFQISIVEGHGNSVYYQTVSKKKHTNETGLVVCTTSGKSVTPSYYLLTIRTLDFDNQYFLEKVHRDRFRTYPPGN